jgi:hypothetical protein
MRVALEAWVAWGFLQGRNGLSRVFPRRERSVAERVEERLPLADRFAREFLEAWLSGALAAVAWALFVTASDAELSAAPRLGELAPAFLGLYLGAVALLVVVAAAQLL